MVWIAGVDGCRAGWFRAARNTGTGECRFDVVASAAELLSLPPSPTIIALDIPIGLPDAGSRDCDIEARKRLGPRRSSVFPAPIRPAIHAESRAEASGITFDRDGKKVSQQAWGIFRKIREVDALLQSGPDARSRLYEVHPEVCFWAMAGEQPMPARKKSREGKAARQALLEEWLKIEVLATARGGWLKKELADDDILDAAVALWTAERIVSGTALSLPAAPPHDATGLPMRIVY